MAQITGRVRLPIAFDSAALRADANALPATAWEAHFNRALYRNEWSGVALRGRQAAGLYTDPHGNSPVRDTPWLERCPNVRAALALISCEMTAVRFLRVGAGSAILEHRDYDLTEASGEARLHVCVQTNESVRFLLDGDAVPMYPGSCWYLDVSRPHSVTNDGESARIHLVLDCIFNDWLREMMETAVIPGQNDVD